MIHGDLKGVSGCSQYLFTAALTLGQINVLVSKSGHACLADFGLAMVIRGLDSIPSTSGPHSYTPQWSAPEVLSQTAHSKEADIFAFAMVMIEVHHG